MHKPNTPKLAVDAILIRKGNIILVERKHPPLGFALVGGFVDIGETCKEAVFREVREETGLLSTSFSFVGVYDNPKRDTRWADEQIISIAYVCKAVDGKIKAQKEEVNQIVEVSIGRALGMILIADHRQIIMDALETIIDRRKYA